MDTSCGYAIYPEHSQKIDEIRIMADHRMYEDKLKTENVEGYITDQRELHIDDSQTTFLFLLQSAMHGLLKKKRIWKTAS